MVKRDREIDLKSVMPSLRIAETELQTGFSLQTEQYSCMVIIQFARSFSIVPLGDCNMCLADETIASVSRQWKVPWLFWS